MQAGIQLACNLVAALGSVAYFLLRNSMRKDESEPSATSTIPRLWALKILLRPTLPIFIESAVRNAFCIWLVATIVSMGNVYATAWGIFGTIRWAS